MLVCTANYKTIYIFYAILPGGNLIASGISLFSMGGNNPGGGGGMPIVAILLTEILENEFGVSDVSKILKNLII